MKSNFEIKKKKIPKGDLTVSKCSSEVFFKKENHQNLLFYRWISISVERCYAKNIFTCSWLSAKSHTLKQLTEFGIALDLQWKTPSSTIKLLSF